jgi:putative peptidoglycan lipid II flippase
MLKNLLSVSGFTLISRLTGFLRDAVLAILLGAGPVSDAFFVAFRLPNHFRAFFAEGAFQAAFVPEFTKVLTLKGRAGALDFGSRVSVILLAANLVLLGLMMVFARETVLVLAPGYARHPEQLHLAASLLRITTPYLLFISLATLLSGVLNAIDRFGAAAAAPILLNICMVVAILGLGPYVATRGHALAWGVLAAGIAQFVYLDLAARRAGLPILPRFPRWTPDIASFFKRLGPASLGAGLVQLSLFIDTIIASFLPAGAISYLYFADRLNQLPLAVIGIALGTVLLPELSRLLAAEDSDKAARSLNNALEIAFLFGLPSSLALGLIGDVLIAGLFQHGAFTAEDTRATANTLGAYAIGLMPFIAVRCLVPAFYARGDTATPVKVAAVALFLNICLKLVLTRPFAQSGIAFATSLGAWTNALVLGFLLWRRGQFKLEREFLLRLGKVCLAALVMSVVLLVLKSYALGTLSHMHTTARLAVVGGFCTAGALFFGGALHLLRYRSFAMLRAALRRAR